MKRRLSTLFALAFLVSAGGAAAQEHNYWTNSYGTNAQLLAGVVVGSTGDLSATFYNPGAIIKTPDSSLIISTQALQLESLSFQNESSDAVELQSVDFSVAPNIFALRVTNKTAPHQFAVSGLTRYSSTFRDYVSVNLEGDVIPSNPGDEYYASRLDTESRLWEGWGGLSWSHAVGSRVGLGVTQYVAYREQHIRLASSAAAAAPGGVAGASEDIARKYDYTHIRLLWKLGAFYDSSRFDFGFAVTTPGIALLSGGSAYYNHTIVNGGGTPQNDLASDSEQDPDISYRSPFSIAGGASYLFGRTKLHATLEWFGGADEYTVIDPGSFDAQVTGETVSYPYTIKTKPVLNAGFGIEHKFSDLLSAYGSFITDFSSAGDTDGSQTGAVGIDRYHISAGSAFTVRRLHLTVGLGYGFGGSPVQRDTGLYDSALSGPVGKTLDGDVKYRRYLLLFGFAID
jgi:hypothetical protein